MVSLKFVIPNVDLKSDLTAISNSPRNLILIHQTEFSDQNNEVISIEGRGNLHDKNLSPKIMSQPISSVNSFLALTFFQ